MRQLTETMDVQGQPGFIAIGIALVNQAVAGGLINYSDRFSKLLRGFVLVCLGPHFFHDSAELRAESAITQTLFFRGSHTLLARFMARHRTALKQLFST